MKNPLLKYGLILSALTAIILLNSCRDTPISDDPDEKLEFSNDTLLFDTVFTTFGSTTKFFKVFNPNANKALNISSVMLAGGEQSPYRLNIDGEATNAKTDIQIEPLDSMYVFAELTVDPSGENLPFVVQDSVVFNVNGNLQDVDLVAYGQNAHFLFRDTLKDDVVWQDDKPYVIIEYIEIDSLATLTIEEGVRVHMHNGASIVATGSMIVNGTKDSVVTFQGTRLEANYQDIPGQWGGIFLQRNPNATYSFEYTNIRNAIFGLGVGLDLNQNYFEFVGGEEAFCTVKNSIVQNSFGANIYTLASNVYVENTLIYNSNNPVWAALGGYMEMVHTTISSPTNSRYTHTTPSVILSGIFQAAENLPLATAPLEAKFTNCIVWGGIEEEIGIIEDTLTFASFDYTFENCILKTDSLTDPNYVNCILNDDPLFKDRSEEDFNILEYSPAINNGTNAVMLNTDQEGNPRDDGLPDIGALEFFPE